MIGQVLAYRLNSCLTQKHLKIEAYMESAWRLLPPTLTGALTSPAARCSCPPAFVLVSLRRRLCMNAVSIPQRLLLHFTAKGTTVCTGSGCALVGKCPIRAPLCTSPSGEDGTWQTRLAELPAQRRIWDVSDCLDGLAHRVATFLPMLLLPFHFVLFTQALQRHPPVTARNCTHPQSSARLQSISTDNKKVLGSARTSGGVAEVCAGSGSLTFLYYSLDAWKINRTMRHF